MKLILIAIGSVFILVWIDSYIDSIGRSEIQVPFKEFRRFYEKDSHGWELCPTHVRYSKPYGKNNQSNEMHLATCDMGFSFFGIVLYRIYYMIERHRHNKKYRNERKKEIYQVLNQEENQNEK